MTISVEPEWMEVGVICFAIVGLFCVVAMVIAFITGIRQEMRKKRGGRGGWEGI